MTSVLILYLLIRNRYYKLQCHAQMVQNLIKTIKFFTELNLYKYKTKMLNDTPCIYKIILQLYLQIVKICFLEESLNFTCLVIKRTDVLSDEGTSVLVSMENILNMFCNIYVKLIFILSIDTFVPVNSRIIILLIQSLFSFKYVCLISETTSSNIIFTSEASYPGNEN